MITDASWEDIDGDHDPDLIVVGEYTPIKVFLNESGKLKEHTAESGLSNTEGWWNKIQAGDLDQDGDIDFVVGNHGLNSRFRASIDKPVCMYVNDFDQNGTIEQIICNYYGDQSYPMVLRHDLVSQIPSLKKKYLKYESYKDQTITDIFTPEQMKDAVKLDVHQLKTSVLINDGSGKFTVGALPIEAQAAPMYGITITDLDGDGQQDILLGGNLYRTKPEVGRYDASYGVYLSGDGKGNFTVVSAKESGIKIDGEVRDILTMKTTKGDLLLISRNNNSLVVFKKNAK